MSLDQPDIKELRALVDWVNLSPDVRELSVTIGDVALFISRDRQASRPQAAGFPSAAVSDPVATVPAAMPAAAIPAASPAPVASSVPPAPGETDAAVSASDLGADEVLIKAPMVGTFYGSPKPGDPPFVNVGDTVAETTVLGIVEVMKLMNNIEAKIAGSVTRVLVDNEQAVEYGQPLMVIRRNG